MKISNFLFISNLTYFPIQLFQWAKLEEENACPASHFCPLIIVFFLLLFFIVGGAPTFFYPHFCSTSVSMQGLVPHMYFCRNLIINNACLPVKLKKTLFKIKKTCKSPRTQFFHYLLRHWIHLKLINTHETPLLA